METNQVIIAGAGLAGLTAAIHLSKAGIPVTLIDKNEFPKHKVCGEYISNEVLPYLNWLGIDPEELHPAHISKIEFSTADGKKIEGELPLGGFGISRYALDHLMFQKAVASGCRFVQQTINTIDFDADRFTISLADGQKLQSRLVLGAFGKRSNIDQKMHRRFILRKSPWLAVKGHYRGNLSDDVVGLHNFQGGYCGVSKVENDTINICYLADFETFKKFKNIDQYQSEVLCKNPILQSIFEKSQPVFDKPMTISQISFDKKNCVENHILMIGDTAGLIHPLCGNGMAMAVHSAKIVSELIVKYFNGQIDSREALEKTYQKQWKSQFESRLRTGRLLGSLFQMPQLSTAALQLLTLFPSLLPKIIRHTHGQLLTVPQ